MVEVTSICAGFQVSKIPEALHVQSDPKGPKWTEMVKRRAWSDYQLIGNSLVIEHCLSQKSGVAAALCHRTPSPGGPSMTPNHTWFAGSFRRVPTSDSITSRSVTNATGT
jgi:hypothetical protein